jgi:hypothetical protein
MGTCVTSGLLAVPIPAQGGGFFMVCRQLLRLARHQRTPHHTPHLTTTTASDLSHVRRRAATHYYDDYDVLQAISSYTIG